MPLRGGPPHSRYSVDLLTRPGEAFSWQDLAADCEEIEVGSRVVRVASPRMLYRMKKDTARLQDRADAARLREAFDLEDD